MPSAFVHDELPSSDSVHLTLTHPSSAEIQRVWTTNFPAWGGRLPQDVYLRREAHLASQELTRDGGVEYWILTDEGRAEGERCVYASCETFRKQALVSHCQDGNGNGSRNGNMIENGNGIMNGHENGDEDGNGLSESDHHSALPRFEKVTSYGIGSVFCQAKYRSHGYASRMINELAKQLDERSKASFTVLYSDIGKTFYARSGWEPFRSSHISLPPATHQSHSCVKTRELLHEDIKELCRRDEDMLRLSMQRSSSNTTRVALVPDAETIMWHHAREDFFAKEMLGRQPIIKGALATTGKSGDSRRVWCFWSRFFGNSSTDGDILNILRIVVEGEEAEVSIQDSTGNGAAGMTNGHHRSSVDSQQHHTDVQDAIAAVLQAAQREAANWDMQEVQIWNPSPSVVAVASRLDPSVELVYRDKESIASLRWHGGNPAGARIEWIGNEKYGWC